MRRGWTILFSPLVVTTAVVTALGMYWLSDLAGEEPTLGTITVGSPAVYTRERLVNDRFIEDAWLSAQLDPATGVQDALAVETERREALLRALVSGQTSAEPAPSAANPPGLLPRLSTRALLFEEVDYRQVVRSLTIENQLDDRHDLNGNSLYRFKFDASVLPGRNTKASARLAMKLRGPAFLAETTDEIASLAQLGDTKQIESWRSIYRRWIENLRSRLNRTHDELKQDFHNNDFSHNDYAHLIAFVSRNLDVSTDDLPGCQKEMESLQGLGSSRIRLSAEGHAERKKCIRSMVARSIPAETSIAVPLGNQRIGEYVETAQDPAQSTPRATRTTPQEVPPRADNRPRQIHEAVEQWLNAFFGAKTLKLVMGGLAIPESSFVRGTFYDIPAFEELARLVFFNGTPDATSGHSVFLVTERVFSVAAIDPTKVKDDADLEWLSREHSLVVGHRLQDFQPGDYGTLHASRLNLQAIRNEPIRLSSHDFREVSPGTGLYSASAEVGLLNFVISAKRRGVSAFTYGVTPKESADSVAVEFSTSVRADGGTAGTEEVHSSGARLGRESSIQSIERRSVVVGFSAATTDPGTAEFGWVIQPGSSRLDGMRNAYVQKPAQYALAALVSIPSWWSEVQLDVTTEWLGIDGAPIEGSTNEVSYSVEVPMEFEPLETLLLGIEQLGPELMESRLDPIVLTACRPGAIVIPGRRLWRSTVVTLGYQIADSIAVLPNMKGIIARFDQVENQMSLQEGAAQSKDSRTSVEIQRAVKVWTSQGSLTLPNLARIGVPSGMPMSCDTPEDQPMEAGPDLAAYRELPERVSHEP